ncbi:MAG: hypothetical protein ACREXS_18700 [Gammaproteobacteria bacterium]
MFSTLESFKDKLERDQCTNQLERFPPPYLKKAFGRHGRLLIEEQCRDQNVALCFSRYLIRGEGEYSDFLKDPQAFHARNGVPPPQVDAFLRDRLSIHPLHALPAPNQVELGYLRVLSANRHPEDLAVLESYLWVERASAPWVRDYLPRYWEIVEAIVAAQDPVETVRTHGTYDVLYRYFPSVKKIFLVAPLDPENRRDRDELCERYCAVLDVGLTEEEILRNSRRAYPAIIALDERIWVNTQKSVDANLALSPEEEQILEAMSSTVGSARYPLFINGRPGSGKSTILQYLFAEHLAHHLVRPQNERVAYPPLYLTYSEGLLERARIAVENILKCGVKGALEWHIDIDDQAIRAQFNGAFCSFREFLRGFLPSETAERFSADRYVSFNKFRRLWAEYSRRHPDKEVRRLSAELSWHAVRMYIKGMRYGENADLDPDIYREELARDRRSLTPETFEAIYRCVWERWYDPFSKKEALWDDQDLTRAVLEADVELARYPAIFCDEAQDFTTIELELIRKISLFSARSVEPYLLKDVPFAFAGDPFQTLNPTGFDWASTQAGFYDHIVRQLDRGGRANLEFNFQELAFNYRSSEHIVRFGNLVHLLRGAAFEIPGLVPQKSWPARESVSPFWFRDGDASCRDAIRLQEEIVILIPCQEGGELDYVDRDPFLRNLALRDGEIARNILSPMRAKGLEYDRVVLYKFGDLVLSEHSGLVERITNPDSTAPDLERKLPWEYLLNQIYVATSRARRRLFIVDSNEALERFWCFATPDRRRDLLSRYGSDAWKADDVGGMTPGENNSWYSDRDDPRELAHLFEEQGEAQEDPYLMNLARVNFERAGQPERAELCHAKALLFERRFEEAGDMFSRLGRAGDAAHCYWMQYSLDKLRTLLNQFPELKGDARCLAAQFLMQSEGLPEAQFVLEAICRLRLQAGKQAPAADQWSEFIAHLIERLLELGEGVDPPGLEPLSQQVTETLKHLGISSTRYPRLAELLYRCGHPREAIEHWRHSTVDHPDPEWLLRAQAETEPYPERLKYLRRLRDDSGIVRAFVAEGTVPTGQFFDLVLESAKQTRNGEALLRLVKLEPRIGALMAFLEIAAEQRHRDWLASLPSLLIQGFIRAREWKQLLSFVCDQIVSEGRCNSLLQEQGIRWDPHELRTLAVGLLARSDELAREAENNQQKVSKFLRECLCLASEINWTRPT